MTVVITERRVNVGAAEINEGRTRQVQIIMLPAVDVAGEGAELLRKSIGGASRIQRRAAIGSLSTSKSTGTASWEALPSVVGWT